MQFFKQLAEGRLLGHPIHTMLVHFPSAFLPTFIVFDGIAKFLDQAFYAAIGFYLLGLGVFFGILAAIFGGLDYFKLKTDDPAWKVASLHGILNFTWLMIFGTIFGLRMLNYPKIEIPGIAELCISVVTVLGLVISNYLGGELVYRYHLGSKNSNK